MVHVQTIRYIISFHENVHLKIYSNNLNTGHVYAIQIQPLKGLFINYVTQSGGRGSTLALLYGQMVGLNSLFGVQRGEGVNFGPKWRYVIYEWPLASFCIPTENFEAFIIGFCQIMLNIYLTCFFSRKWVLPILSLMTSQFWRQMTTNSRPGSTGIYLVYCGDSNYIGIMEPFKLRTCSSLVFRLEHI